MLRGQEGTETKIDRTQTKVKRASQEWAKANRRLGSGGPEERGPVLPFQTACPAGMRHAQPLPHRVVEWSRWHKSAFMPQRLHPPALREAARRGGCAFLKPALRFFDVFLFQGIW